jgi:folate-binding protein YgfZ
MQGTASTEGGADARGKIAPLADRGVVRLRGPDALTLLQGLVTQDLDLLKAQPAAFAALLSPQGKILFDFFVVRDGEDLLLDVAREKAGDLVKRLTLYRLRAKVTFEAATELAVFALWGGALPSLPTGGVAYADPRLPALGARAIVPAAIADDWAARTAAPVPVEQWHAHRVALGVPEGGHDFTYGDAFPHEADMDQLAGVSFSKGCYVGQEVVSRMQHRGTARKRFVQVTGARDLPGGAPIMAGAATIGSITSVEGTRGLALVRLDRAAEAKAKGEPIEAAGIALEIVKPAWATFDLVPPARETSHDL